ncbi:hypothetical protein [Roseobacter weihaiensis]|uniref:hypothetical protein n=1 Tax=Roseobacter weihaiensis TaxID=2763262 RepID=UPI001D0B5467|nr:hypothetical protein [Roseobacter sp. H9]
MIRCSALFIITGVMLMPSQVAAQGNLKVATQNMRLAFELCLHNYRTPLDLPYAFSSTDFTLGKSLDEGVTEFSAPGISGTFQAGYCNIQTPDVPLAIAEDMGQRTAETLFPGMVTLGNPERNINQPVAPCDGLSIFAPQMLIRVTYSAAGNSGDCLNDGSSAIAIQM